MADRKKGDQSGVSSVLRPTDEARTSSDEGAAILDTTRTKWTKRRAADNEQLVAKQRAAAQADAANEAALAEHAKLKPETREEWHGVRPEEQVTVKNVEASRSPEAVANALLADDNAAEAVCDKTRGKLLDFMQACFDLSHDKISRRYHYWQEAEQAHDLYVPTQVIERIKRGKSKGRTKPRIIDTIRTPYARAILDVNATYMLAVFGGFPPFKIEPVRKASLLGAKVIETELSANMRRIGYERHIYQMAVDQGRYGMSPMACFYGQKGNQLLNLDPWDYFPDPRVSAQNRDEADFVGTRGTASLTALRRRGIYACLDDLEPGDEPTFSWACNRDVRERIRGQSIDPTAPTHTEKSRKEYKLGRARVVNTLYAFFDPKEIAGVPAPFGLYRITAVDEKHIVLFDKCPWPHQRIPIVHGEADYDAHKNFGSSTYDLLMPLQRFQDWLLRSRVENVQSIIQARLIVDPNRVHIGDILEPNSARMIRALPGVNPKDAILPVDVPDATKGFWQELDTAGQLMQRLMAANDTAQGVQTDTERTATEIARLTALGQQRQGTRARLLSATMIRDLVGMMVKNIQYFGIHGGITKLPAELAKSADGWYEWKHGEILGEFDYVVTDGTLPVDPRANPANLLRAIRILGETGMFSKWSADKFIEQYLTISGFVDLDTWRLTPEQARKQQQMMQQQMTAQDPNAQAALTGAAAQMAQATGQAPQMTNQVVPDDQIARDRERGNVVPISEAAREIALNQPPVPLRN
jgi:hypothetical protein